MKILKGDTVLLITGKDKGKTGKIERVFPATNKVLIDGLNQYKRHVKARTTDQKSEIVVLSRPLPVSNVIFLCPKCGKPARIGYSTEKGKKVRVCKNCKKII